MYEKWDELEHQFRAETKQDAPPFGPGVLEWDYSRYTRALGFGKAPGLDTLRRRACVVTSGRYAFRDEAARHLKKWGADVGWDFIRVSARPSTLVPDPVIYQLGIEVTHPDSLIFCAAGQQGTAVVGKRPRSPAMRIPLTASERWLIAADRVRRRLRCEIATRGLVLYIDDAEYLTPSALTTLSYLLDAQCAWKSHFLSSPAQVYIAFSLPAEHDGWFHETLARFNPLATPFRVREPIGPLTLADAAKAPNLTVEEEHVAEVLAEAEVALTEQALLRLFGASVRLTVRSLIRHGVVRRRYERRKSVYHVRDGLRSSRGASKAAAISAVFCEMREEARSNRWSNAPSFVGQQPWDGQSSSPEADGASTPEVAQGASVALLLGRRVLERAPTVGKPHAHLSYTIAVHQRRHRLARLIVKTLLQEAGADTGDARELVQLICSTGRTSSDRIFTGDFWSGFSLSGVDPVVADLICVLLELFARMRRMSIGEMISRHEVTTALYSSGFAEVDSRGDHASCLRGICAAILWRNYFLLRGRRVGGDQILGLPPSVPELVDVLQLGGVPAYVLGSALYAHELAPNRREANVRFRRDIGLVRDLQLTAAQPEDCRVALGLEMNRCVARSRRLSLSGLADEVVLLFDFALPPRARTSALHVLFRLFGRTGQSVAASRYLLQRGVGDDGPSSLRNATAMVAAPFLVRAGEVTEARKMCLISASEKRESALVRAMAAVQVLIVDFDYLNWTCFARGARASLEFDAPHDPALVNCVDGIAQGYGQLALGRFESAVTVFDSARRAIGVPLPGESGALHRVASDGSRIARRIGSVRSRVRRRRDPFSDPAEFLMRAWFGSSSSTPGRSLAVVALLLEEWARATPAARPEAVISTVLSIQRLWGKGLRNAGRSVCSALQRASPVFFEQLLRSVQPAYSIPMVGDSISSRLEIALESLADHWDCSGTSQYCWDLDQTLRPDPTDVGTVSVDLSTRNRGAWSEDSALYKGAQFAARALRANQGCPEGPDVVMAGSFDSTVGLWHCRRYIIQPAGRRLHVTKHEGAREPSSCRGTYLPDSRRCGSAGFHARRRDRDSLVGRPLDADSSELVGSSEQARNLREVIRRASGCAFPVLIVGETGTGKELVAKLIHRGSALAHRPMTTANCGAISGSVLEAELFGCVRGAYTGASAERDGLFASADGTTLLLDELDSMPIRMQAAVLRALDSGEFRRLGENRVRYSEFRTIAISSPRLLRALETGGFRQDLYYRLSAITIHVPTLAERSSDIADLARWHVRRFEKRIESSCLDMLVSREWPGNVRQLFHCLDVAVSFEPTAIVGAKSLRLALASTCGPSSLHAPRAADGLPEAARHGAPAFRRGEQFSSADFMCVTSLSRRSAQRHLSKLTALGMVDRTGAGRATKYEASQSIYWPLPRESD